MRLSIAILLALAGGLVFGFVISELIGIIGFLAFDRTAGLQFFPIYTAILSAGAAYVFLRRKSR